MVGNGNGSVIILMCQFESIWIQTYIRMKHDKIRSSQFVLPITLSVENKYEYAIILLTSIFNKSSNCKDYD